MNYDRYYNRSSPSSLLAPLVLSSMPPSLYFFFFCWYHEKRYTFQKIFVVGFFHVIFPAPSYTKFLSGDRIIFCHFKYIHFFPFSMQWKTNIGFIPLAMFLRYTPSSLEFFLPQLFYPTQHSSSFCIFLALHPLYPTPSGSLLPPFIPNAPGPYSFQYTLPHPATEFEAVLFHLRDARNPGWGVGGASNGRPEALLSPPLLSEWIY